MRDATLQIHIVFHCSHTTLVDQGAGPSFRTRPSSSVPSDGTLADILDARARRREAGIVFLWPRSCRDCLSRGLQLPEEQLSTDSLQDAAT